MKPYAIGKSIVFREIQVSDAEFVLGLRLDLKKNQFISSVPNDIEKQRNFICDYLNDNSSYYFIICNKINFVPVGTIRIYDIQGDSFCWGSWILSQDASKFSAIESALLIYDFAFLALHYKKSHFDVRKNNTNVVEFHKRFGAEIVEEDEENYYFQYDLNSYLLARKKYQRYLA